MTARERVHAALRHEQPDRTPRDFWAEPPAWNRLFDHLGHSDRDRLLDSLGVDRRHLEAAVTQSNRLEQNAYGEMTR